MTIRYHYSSQSSTQTKPESTKNNTPKITDAPRDEFCINLDDNTPIGHGTHWRIILEDLNKLPTLLQHALQNAKTLDGNNKNTLLITSDDDCHITQIFALDDHKPTHLISAYPSAKSAYAYECTIKQVITYPNKTEALLKLALKDGTTVYAFDARFAAHASGYEPNTPYAFCFCALAYDLAPANTNEYVTIDDKDAILHHRAFNEIVLQNDGNICDDMDAKIAQKISEYKKDNIPTEPVQVNFGHSCIYLFGENFGQEDEAWCQGQVLGKKISALVDVPVYLFDVAILKEHGSQPLVIKIYAPKQAQTDSIAVGDYVQASIWLQTYRHLDKNT